MDWSKFLSRKLIVQMIIFVTGTTLLAFSLIDATNWVTLVQWTFAMYVASNIGEHYTNGKK